MLHGNDIKFVASGAFYNLRHLQVGVHYSLLSILLLLPPLILCINGVLYTL